VRRGITVIEMYQDDKATPVFHHLKYSRMSLEIKFSAYFTPPTSEVDLLSTIISSRNDLLRRSKYEVSPYSLVFGVIQLSLLHSRTTVDAETNTVDRTSANLRKSPSDLTDRSIKNVTTKVISSVDKVVGETNSLYFLKSAVKILDFKKRKYSMLLQDEENEDSSGDDEEDSDSEECEEYEEYMSDSRLITALDNLPQRNIADSSDDIENVLGIFDVVKEMVSEKKSRSSNFKSASLTADILSENSYYSQLTGRTLLRWYKVKDKQSEKPGRKINENFEAEVWGKLMLCIFEKSNENVSATAVYTIQLNRMSCSFLNEI
jgi:hypothetical protein